MNNADCVAAKRENFIRQTKNELADWLPVFFKRPSYCHNLFGIGVKNLSSYSDSEIFSLWQCNLKSQHTLNTPAATIALHYADIQMKASLMMCTAKFAHDSKIARDIYLKYWLESGKRADIWSQAAGDIIF